MTAMRFVLLALLATPLAAQEGQPSPGKLDPDTVAIVNGKRLSRGDFHRFLEAQLGSSYLQQFISNHLVEEEARHLGVKVSEADVERRLDEYLTNVAARYGGDHKKFLDEIQRSGTDPESWKESIRTRFRNDALLEQIVRKSRKVSDEELRQAFERTYGEQGTRITVRHILFSTNLLAPKYKDRFSEKEFFQNLDQIEKEAKARCEGFLERVRSGEDFEKVALESDDFTNTKGGDLGENWRNRYGEEFDRAAEPLKIGEIAGPVKSAIGFHVLQAQPAEFDEKFQARQIVLLADVGSPGREETRRRAQDILRQLQEGADFAALARKHSEDKDSRDRGGVLEPFGRGEKVPAIEGAVAALAPGQISPLVETDFGLHILRLDGRTQTPKGDRKKVAHILVSTQFWKVRENRLKPIVEEEARARAEAALKEIRGGADFNEVCLRESDEVFTRQNGGLLENYSRHRVSPEFHEALLNLKPGETSGLIKTPHGFHIARVDRTDVTRFEDVREELLRQETAKPATPLEMQNLRQELERKAVIER